MEMRGEQRGAVRLGARDGFGAVVGVEPERFSMTTGRPNFADRCWPRMRGIRSPFDLGGSGTTMRMGQVG
jgi:hypothetical protein